VGFISLQSFVCRPAHGLFGLPRGASPARHFRRDGALSGRPSSASCEAGSFSRAFRPLRSLFACLPGHSFRSDTVLPGVSSLFAALSGGVHLRGSSQAPATFRPQAFSASRRLAPPPASRACFIPQPRPGFSVQGFLSLRSATGSSPATASMPFSVRALTGCPAATRVRRDFEALLHEVMRSIRFGVYPCPMSLPSSASPPPGFLRSNRTRLPGIRS
jgi:hypothetical protein